MKRVALCLSHVMRVSSDLHEESEFQKTGALGTAGLGSTRVLRGCLFRFLEVLLRCLQVQPLEHDTGEKRKARPDSQTCASIEPLMRELCDDRRPGKGQGPLRAWSTSSRRGTDVMLMPRILELLIAFNEH
jgi:hypothetical protein